MQFEAYVFDAYGTLFDVHSAVRAHAPAVGPKHEAVSALWRVKQLEYTWVRTLMGRYVDFLKCTEDALVFTLRTHGLHTDALTERLLSAYQRLAAYDDVEPSLAALKQRGARTAILSNGTPEMLRAAVEAAGIGHLLDQVISVDRLQRYKTDPAAYALVEQALGVGTAAVSFQSSNKWDVAGAAAHGFRCVHVNRLATPAEYGDVVAPAEVRDLDGLLQLDGVR